jgi:hypothetical protein
MGAECLCEYSAMPRLPTDQVRPSHLCETLELVSKKWYPHLYCILKIYLTMPPSTATTERSFSVLKRVKTYLRATMWQDRLSVLALLHIHRDIQPPLDAVVFNNTRQRKLLSGWLFVTIHYIIKMIKGN